MPTERLSMRHIREVLRLHYSVGMSQRAVERAERRARLVSAIMRGRGWLDEIMTGSITDPEQLAKREQCSLRQVNLTLSLAFLAPQLVKAAAEERPAHRQESPAAGLDQK